VRDDFRPSLLSAHSVCILYRSSTVQGQSRIPWWKGKPTALTSVTFPLALLLRVPLGIVVCMQDVAKISLFSFRTDLMPFQSDSVPGPGQGVG
jgi:hypothetical protein